MIHFCTLKTFPKLLLSDPLKIFLLVIIMNICNKNIMMTIMNVSWYSFILFYFFNCEMLLYLFFFLVFYFFNFKIFNVIIILISQDCITWLFMMIKCILLHFPLPLFQHLANLIYHYIILYNCIYNIQTQFSLPNFAIVWV